MPDPTPDRCPTCDRSRATDALAAHKDGCTCAECMAVCWRDWGTLCDPADWRARAIAAERQVCRMLSGDTIESDSLCPHEPSKEGLRAIAAERRAAEAEAAIESRAAALVAERSRAAPEVEAAIQILINGMSLNDWEKATRVRRVTLTDAIARAIADAREQGRREAIEQAPEVEEAIGEVAPLISHSLRCGHDIESGCACTCHVERDFSALRAAIAAAQARAVEAARVGWVEAVSEQTALGMISAFEDALIDWAKTWRDSMRPAVTKTRAALLAALTGAKP